MDELAVAMKARDFIAKCQSACAPRVDRCLCRSDRRGREIRSAARKRRCVVGEAPERQVPHLRKLRPQRPSPALQRLPRGGTRRARKSPPITPLRVGASRGGRPVRSRATSLPPNSSSPTSCSNHASMPPSWASPPSANLPMSSNASLMSTGSRFATFSRELCAFVLSEGGKVRYSSRSTSLRDAKAWIRSGSDLSKDSQERSCAFGPGTVGTGGSRPRSMVRRLGP